MIQSTIFIIIGIVGILAGYYFTTRRKTMGLGAVGRRQSEKNANISKLKEYLNGKERVTNDDIERFLEVSDSTATRYMHDLEREGFVEQVGGEGRYVYYKVK